MHALSYRSPPARQKRPDATDLLLLLAALLLLKITLTCHSLHDQIAYLSNTARLSREGLTLSFPQPAVLHNTHANLNLFLLHLNTGPLQEWIGRAPPPPIAQITLHPFNMLIALSILSLFRLRVSPSLPFSA